MRMRDGGLGALLLAAVVVAQEPATTGPAAREAKASQPLARGVMQADRLLAAMTTADKGAKETIWAAKVLDGYFRLILLLEKKDTQADGGVQLHGTVRVRRGGADRYMSLAERDRLTDLKSSIDDLERRKLQEILEIRARKDRLSPLPIDAAEWQRDARKANLRLIEESAQHKGREYDDRIAGKKRDLAAAQQEVSHNVEARRQVLDTLAVSVVLDKKSAGAIDMGSLIKLRRLKLAAVVSDFEIGREPKELGSKLCVMGLTLKVVDLDGDLRATGEDEEQDAEDDKQLPES
jgi:hypothetical protein